MDYFLNTRLKIRKFFRKYKRIILIVIVIWLVIIAVNYFLKRMRENEKPSTTYEPNISVMDNSEVPKSLQEPINNLIGEFVNYCNDKEYEKAYNLIDSDCREAIYPTIDKFKVYVDSIFSSKKIYNIQNFSNVNKNYIYDVRILDDILTTGASKGYAYYQEKFVMKSTKEGLKLCIGGFVQTDNLNIVAEDEYMKVQIKKRVVNYDTEKYYLTITNRSQYPILLLDGTLGDEIALDIGNQDRKLQTSEQNLIIIYPKENKEVILPFTKFVDDGRTSSKLKFNAVRILRSYSGDSNKMQEELENAYDKYSLNIDLKQK